ncbi:DUF2254 domain-containing protein [Streptomyces lividans]|uniref:DUF2254 domain-containing protein n=2 Tax=Streptomyces lividans TaxID=1916 RepID=A0ABN4DLW9_STRLI|nr:MULTISPECIES: DUF2254 domain-containing protein [Streptomyces]AIJ12112.1 hypothetical protein SLIV_05485 [Streptomyces lividans TK24]MBQ0950929.1 DUF2254 domain-containing protein [Streptomyces sp. RK76]QSJ07620.1 hypothetical protein SLIVDG2_05485 [Streptomyces lividans]QTD68544.1 hypothetical protein SLIVYQS_05485 [Streptomyces lividans TK24] [Streptomyces lividans]
MSDWMVTQGPLPRRRPRVLSPLREHLRDTFWFAPTAAMAGVLVVWLVAQELDAALVRSLQDDGDYDTLAELLRFADDAKTVVSAVGSAMMTFIGVVFSISLVAVQMASGQFTPRVVRLFVRSRITKATFAVFLATFVLTLLVLTSYDSNPDPRAATSVPLVQSVLTLVMVALSLLLFVMYVNATLRLMRVSHVIARIAAESFRVVALMPVPAHGGEAPGLGPVTAWIAHDGQGGVLRDVHIARLVRVARGHGVVLRLVPRIGDFLVPGTPVLAVHGGAAPPRRALRYALSVGVERTFHQDLAFGLRQLSDIGLRALSPAVNDPTTAVQALDRVVQILATLSRRPLDAAVHRDRRGALRLVQPVPGWAELVDLGFAEVRACATGSPQVTRRLMAGLDDLLLLVPPERRAPLLRHRELLRQAVERTAPTAAERVFALRPDRQGIG